MPAFQGATFPELGWLPDTGQLNAVGEAVLAVSAGALEQHSTRAAPGAPLLPFSLYERVFVGHGQEAPVEPSVRRQLTVVCTEVLAGRAGEQQYQFVKGSSGKLAFQTAVFSVEVSIPYPKQQGRAIPTDAITETRTAIWHDGLVVLAALRALCLGGVSHPAIPRCDDVAIGSLQARSPTGGEASWTIDVLVQL